jgi:serralysin
LYGRAGNDSLLGGEGADTLVGGTGTDAIGTYAFGSADTSRDVVRYLALNESGTPKDNTTWDTIYGFKHGQDKIDLHAIDADISRAGNQAFTLVNAFSGAYGEVHLKKDGADMLVEIDGGKNTGIDMVIRVADVGKLDKSDFIL